MSIEWAAKFKCDDCHRYETVWFLSQRKSWAGDCSAYGYVIVVHCPEHRDSFDDRVYDT